MDQKQKNSQDALDLAIKMIRKAHGNDSICLLGSNTTLDIPCLSTGNILLDGIISGGRGLPKGRVIEAFGPESSGKTTFCYSVIASAQSQGGNAAFIDVEHAMDPKYAKACGVNLDKLLFSQPDCGEDALNIAENLIKTGCIDVIVIDSAAALVPKSELDGEAGASHPGAQARLLSQAMRRLVGIISKTKTTLIFTNQIREKIGVMFGNPETTPGGRALKFFASVRIDVRKKDMLKNPDGSARGFVTRFKTVKNKISPPFKEVECPLLFTEGLSALGSLVQAALDHKIITKKAAWFSYQGELIGQGFETVVETLRTTPGLRDAIDAEARKAIFESHAITPAQSETKDADPEGEDPALNATPEDESLLLEPTGA